MKMRILYGYETEESRDGMFDNGTRCVLERNPLIEVICQLRFPDILKIETAEPADFQDAIRADYPGYQKQVEQLPPKVENGRAVAQGTVNNHHFLSADGQWKISLTKNFIALSTRRYDRWETFANRLDAILAAFIKVYAPAFFVRVGLRYINAVNRAALELEDVSWRELIRPGYLGLMGEEDAAEQAFAKCEQSVTVNMPGGSKANIKSGPGTLRKVDNRTGKSEQTQVFLLDIDLFMEGNTPINLAVPALNVVHQNAGSIFRGAVSDTLLAAMGAQEV